MKNTGPPAMYPIIEYASIVKPPIANNQFLIDFVGCFLEGFSGHAAPVTRISEPIRPTRNGRFMLNGLFD